MTNKGTIFLLFMLVSCRTESKVIAIEQSFIDAGLIDIHEIDPTIQVDLVNTSKSKNFFRKDFYGTLTKCYVQKAVALKIKKAQAILKAKHPSYSLLIYDGARPRSVSFMMYKQLKGTPLQKYVANPKTGSMHNYGAAVDVVIVDEKGNEIDMGPNPFRKNNLQLTKLLLDMKMKKKLTDKQKQNRQLLNDVMIQAGFHSIKLEWWHFNVDKKSVIRMKYKIIE